MPKNATIYLSKPQNEVVGVYKSKNEAVSDIRPKIAASGENLNADQLYQITLGAGMLVGFGPAITYPQSITVTTSRQ